MLPSMLASGPMALNGCRLVFTQMMKENLRSIQAEHSLGTALQQRLTLLLCLCGSNLQYLTTHVVIL